MKITFNCEAVTLIFMGGANKQPELRPPSIKGAMRWWFRALYGGHLYSSVANNILEKLHEKESEIFGDTSRNAAFDIIIKNYKNSSEYKLSRDNGDYINYLGHGLSVRKAINTEVTFDIIFNIRTQDENIIKYIIYSFWMLANLGNVGGRSRRGFGGFRIKEIKTSENKLEFIKPNSLDDYKKGIKKIFSSFTINNKRLSSLPDFSVVCNGCWECYILDNSFNSFDEAMEFIGEKLRRHREDISIPTSLKNKRGETINHTFVYKALKDSYDQFLAKENGKKGFSINEQPEWSIFGLPHMIKIEEVKGVSVTNCIIRGESKKEKEKEEEKESLKDKKKVRERRSSPLLIKIVKFDKQENESEYKIILQVFKSKFLDIDIVAKYKKTDINSKKRLLTSYTGFFETGIKFDILDKFINEKETFPNKIDLTK